MSASTSPDNITYPTSTDAFGPLETSFATMATSVQTALSNTKTYRTADHTSLNAMTGMASGALATVIEGGAIFGYTGSIWNQITTAIFATSGARDTAYAKSTAVYRVSTAVARVSTEAFDRKWSTTGSWKPYVANGIMFPIIPGAAPGGAVGPDGLVTWASPVSTFTLDNCFTTDFDHYLIRWDLIGPVTGTAGGCSMQWRTSTPANDATALYAYAGFYYDGGTNLQHDVGGAGQISAPIGFTYSQSTTSIMNFTMDVYQPALARPSRFRISELTDAQELIRNGSLKNSSVHAGIQFQQALACTGTARVYAYNNL